MKLISKTRPENTSSPSEVLARNTQALTLFSLLSNFRLYYAVAIIYFAHITHSYALAISIMSIAQITQAVLEVPTGVLSDRLGRVRCIQIGAVISVTSILMYTLAHSYIILIIGAVLEGLWLALFSGNNNALLYDSASQAGQKDSFHIHYGRINVALETAGFTSAVVGGLVAAWSFTALLWLSVIPQVLAAIVTYRLKEPRLVTHVADSMLVHLKEALTYYRKNMRLRNMSIADIIGEGVGGSMFSLLPAYYRQFLPVWAVGSMVSFNYIASAVGFKLSGWFMRVFKAEKILIFGEVYSRTMGIFALGISTIVSPFLVALSAIPYGPSDVAKQSLLHAEFTDKQRATMASFNSLLTSCLFGAFSFMIGSFADKIGPTKSMLICQVCLVSVLLIYVKLFRKSRLSKRNGGLTS